MKISVTIYSTDIYGTSRNIACSSCGKEIGRQRKLGGKFIWDDLKKDDYIYCPFCGHKLNKDVLKENK